MKSASTELMVCIAQIQQATGSKRAQMIAEARAKFGKVVWSSPKLREWARWAFQTGVKQ